MTPEEALAREAIRHTLARYTMAGDSLRVDEFVATFTEDAVFESEGVSASDSFHFHGHSAIRSWISRWLQAPDPSTEKPHQATFVRHHLATSLIQFSGVSEAKGRTYWTAYTDIGPDHCGYYLDTFRKVGAEWLIAHRRVRLDWRSPQSLFTTAIANTRSAQQQE